MYVLYIAVLYYSGITQHISSLIRVPAVHYRLLLSFFSFVSKTKITTYAAINLALDVQR